MRKRLVAVGAALLSCPVAVVASTLLLLLLPPVQAQTKSLIPVPRIQFFDTSGNPLANGHVHTYISLTTTNQATYTDSGGGTPNANPVVLDAGGFAGIWLTPGEAYTIEVHNSSDVLQWSVDGVTDRTIFDTITTGIFNDIRIVDGTKFTTCQAAEDDLGSNPGLVVIPSTYAGADCTNVSANVVILDLRATAAVSGTSSQSKYLLYSGNSTPLNDIGGIFPSFPRRGLLLVQDEIADSGAGSSGVVESAEDAIQAAIRTLDPHKDVVAVYGQAIMDVAADGGGVWGANFQAIGGSGLDTKLVGLEIDVVNQNTAGALGSETKGAIFINAFSGTIGPAVLIGTGDSGTGRFQNGITFNDNSMDESAGALFGVASGTYNNGIDLSLGTFNGNAILVRNTEGVLFLGTGSDHANIFNSSSNDLVINSGTSGFKVRNQANTSDNLVVSDSGIVTVIATGSLVVAVTNPLEGKVSNQPRWIFKQVDFGDMTAAATADTFTLWTLPANTMIHDVVGTVVTGWSGGSISAAVCSVGTNGGAANDLTLDDNFFAAATRYELHDATASGGKGTLLFDATDKFAPYMAVAAATIEIQCDLTGDNHANATAGQARIYILVSQPLGNTTTEAN